MYHHILGYARGSEHLEGCSASDAYWEFARMNDNWTWQNMHWRVFRHHERELVDNIINNYHNFTNIHWIAAMTIIMFCLQTSRHNIRSILRQNAFLSSFYAKSFTVCPPSAEKHAGWWLLLIVMFDIMSISRWWSCFDAFFCVYHVSFVLIIISSSLPLLQIVVVPFFSDNFACVPKIALL